MTSIGENEIGEHERIWLIYDKDADEPITWSSTPNPYEPFDETPDAAVEYVRADKLESLSERICALDWLGNNTRLSLEHYSPVYCDDPDQRVEWRVIYQSGSINDREYHCVGRGETPLAALKDAMAHDLALAHREGITPQEKDGDD